MSCEERGLNQQEHLIGAPSSRPRSNQRASWAIAQCVAHSTCVSLPRFLPAQHQTMIDEPHQEKRISSFPSSSSFDSIVARAVVIRAKSDTFKWGDRRSRNLRNKWHYCLCACSRIKLHIILRQLTSVWKWKVIGVTTFVSDFYLKSRIFKFFLRGLEPTF